METITTLERFLHLATTPEHTGNSRLKTLALKSSVHMLPEHLNLILFLKNYDCDTFLQTLLIKYIARLAQDQMWGWQAFCLGAFADSPELCMMSIRVPFGQPPAGCLECNGLQRLQ